MRLPGWPNGALASLSAVNELLTDLTWRGLIAQTTDIDELSAHLDAGPISYYVGFDPTAPSLHIGNLVQLIAARRIQQAGHRPILLVGGSTGLIGDPKQAGERAMNPAELVAQWAARIREQVAKFVDFGGEHGATLVNNLDWTAPMNVLDFLRDIGKHFPVNRMLAREVVKARLETGISFTEFSYVLLQSMDYLELYRRYGCTLQTGGSDQWGNITAGVELIRRAEGAQVHALSTPLLTKADGSKFGKTESGTVWLDPAMTSPFAFHQYFLNAEDARVIEYLKIFGNRTREQVAELEAATLERPHQRLAQRALADDVTDLVHSPREREQANRAAAAIFGRGDLAELSESTLTAVVRDVGGGDLAGGLELPRVVDAMVAARITESRSAARRAIAEGGAYVNNVRVTDPDGRLSQDDLLAGRYAILRRGRRTVGAITLVS